MTDRPALPTPFVDTRIATPGGALFARIWGDVAAAPPVILFHDSLGSVDLWRGFPAVLAQRLGRAVVAYDRLGFGRSEARTEPPGREFVGDEARDAVPALRRALGIDRMILVGHSVGGGMATMVAAAHPEATLGLVTIAAQAFVEDRTLAGIRVAQAAFAEPAQFERVVRLHGDKARWVLDAWIDTWLAPSFADWTLDAALRRLRCPVLALHGDRDEYGSDAHPRRIAALPATPTRMVLLPDCGHVPHREQETRVLDEIAGFVAALDGAAGRG
jgi:pimeloyl-ACP methyl ester carboxylesterase